MLCPNCNHNLTPVTIKSDVVQVILDACANCGGVWSDRNETNFIKYKDLTPIINILPKNPVETQKSFENITCPRDHKSLRLMRQESIPQFLSLLKCDTCQGIFFPKKNLLDFKKAQEDKINYFKSWQIPLPSIYAVLLPLLFFVILGSGLLATVYNVGKPQDTRISAKDKISKPVVVISQNNSALIGFTTQAPSISKIKYWLNPNEVIETLVQTTPKTDHSIILSNLEENKTYFYQIFLTDPENVASEVYTFVTKSN